MNPDIQSQLQKTAYNDQLRQREQVKSLVEKIEAENFENKAGGLNKFKDWDELKILVGAKDRPVPKKQAAPKPEATPAPDDPGAKEKTQSEGSGDATPKKGAEDVKPKTGKKAGAVKSPAAKLKAAGVTGKSKAKK